MSVSLPRRPPPPPPPVVSTSSPTPSRPLPPPPLSALPSLTARHPTLSVNSATTPCPPPPLDCFDDDDIIRTRSYAEVFKISVCRRDTQQPRMQCSASHFTSSPRHAAPVLIKKSWHLNCIIMIKCLVTLLFVTLLHPTVNSFLSWFSCVAYG